MLSTAAQACARTTRVVASKRSLSTAASQPKRLVISRRVWQEHAKTIPKKPRVKKERVDDKPWPRSVQIAGAVAGGIFIPYSTLWLITSNPSLRALLGDYLPMESLRDHFGEIEWDVQSYVDQQEQHLAGQEVEKGYYQFPEECGFQARCQQARTEAMEGTKVTANIYVMGDHEVQHSKTLPAGTRVNPEVLSKLVGSTEGKAVAVDFEEEAENSMATGEGTMTELDGFSSNDNLTRPLLQETHTFSTWHFHNSGAQTEQAQATQASDAEMEESRLEFVIAELERDLKDLNCTRDIDGMMSELKQAKRDLSRLKWKRRLGMQ